MPKTKSYKDWLGAKLADPARAARYLNTARSESEAAFYKALRKVAAAQSRQMTELAEAVGVSRESLYRMMSETGNPSHENVSGILGAMGFKIEIVPVSAAGPSGGEGAKKHAPTNAERILIQHFKGFSSASSACGIAEGTLVNRWSGLGQRSGNEGTLLAAAMSATGVNLPYGLGEVISGNMAPASELPDMSFVLAQQAAHIRSEQTR